MDNPTEELTRVERLVSSLPWAILPESLEQIIAIAQRENESPETVSAKLGKPLKNTRVVSIREGVAVIPVTGPIFRYANLFSEISGATSLEVLALDFTAALENADVKAIVLEVNSPGGQADGTSEFADMVYQARGQKPITAYVSFLGASAAYWIASAADRVVLEQSASVGSIGTVLTMDGNRQKGQVQFVSAQSPNKRPDVTTEQGQAQIQAWVDALGQVFVESVARNRGVSVDTVLADFGQGGLLVGKDAVKAGLADSVGTLEGVIAELSGVKNSQKAKGDVKNMENQNPVNREYLMAHHADLMANILNEAQQEGLKAGAEAERERIKAVEEHLMAGHEDLIQKLKFDGKTTGPEAAVAVLNAEKGRKEAFLQNFKADAPAPVEGSSVDPVSESIDENLPLEERCKLAWERNPDLRAEFRDNFGSYRAYMKYSEAGQVKILKK